MIMTESEEAFLEKLHTLLDGLEELVFIVDPETYEIIFANDKFKEVCGGEEGEKCYRVLCGLESPRPSCNNVLVFEGKFGEIHAREYKCDKIGKWFKCFDKAISWFGNRYVKLEVFVDLTDYKEIEQALAESEKRYSTLVEAALDVIYTLASDGTIMSLNLLSKKITGWKCSE